MQPGFLPLPEYQVHIEFRQCSEKHLLSYWQRKISALLKQILTNRHPEVFLHPYWEASALKLQHHV
ncbi:hypothetical protein EGK68_26105 [Enterobacter cloacae]|uniref:Uncharacterized protein n=1 Tax=Enterobacter cloacae TaxID=550 RepID=A0A3R9AZK0_ENTCL|nr:hypothetical protein EGK68_26105 [Enterobacter cloacae]